MPRPSEKDSTFCPMKHDPLLRDPSVADDWLMPPTVPVMLKLAPKHAGSKRIAATMTVEILQPMHIIYLTTIMTWSFYYFFTVDDVDKLYKIFR
jgi:hypothetical protein